MLQVLGSDLDLPRARTAGITIVTAVLALPQMSPDSFIDGRTGACQRLPAFSLALCVSLLTSKSKYKRALNHGLRRGHT